MANGIIDSQASLTFCFYEKLKQWNKLYKSNNNLENTMICCELIEANAKIQHELFKLLRIFVSQGILSNNNKSDVDNIYSPSSIKEHEFYESKHVPIVNCLLTTEPTRNQTSECLWRNELQNSTISSVSLPHLENEILERLIQSQIQCDRLQSQLKSKESDQKQSPILLNTGNSDRNFFNQPESLETCAPITSIEAPVIIDRQLSKQNNVMVSSKPSSVHCIDGQVNLRTSINEVNENHPVIRLQNWLSPLVRRYNEIFTDLRVKTMKNLQLIGHCDYERSQRLIFHAVQTCFVITRQTIRRIYSNSNNGSNLQASNNGFKTTENSPIIPLAEIPLNCEQLDKLVNATLRRLIQRPPPNCACNMTNYLKCGIEPLKNPPNSNELAAIKDLLKEICFLAWKLVAEKHDFTTHGSSHRVWFVDIDRAAKPGDTYDDKCYRRCHDSDSLANQVHHYVWPCLILFSKIMPNSIGPNENRINSTNNVEACILVKGEACTRNPKEFASQRDKASALINHECCMINQPICTNNMTNDSIKPKPNTVFRF